MTTHHSRFWNTIRLLIDNALFFNKKMAKKKNGESFDAFPEMQPAGGGAGT
jgi:hypothetical protein